MPRELNCEARLLGQSKQALLHLLVMSSSRVTGKISLPAKNALILSLCNTIFLDDAISKPAIINYFQSQKTECNFRRVQRLYFTATRLIKGWQTDFFAPRVDEGPFPSMNQQGHHFNWGEAHEQANPLYHGTQKTPERRR